MGHEIESRQGICRVVHSVLKNKRKNTHTCTYVRIHMFGSAYVSIPIYVRKYICMYIYVRKYICTYVNICSEVHVNVYICSEVHMYVAPVEGKPLSPALKYTSIHPSKHTYIDI
jgi:hypothetical protein